MFAKLIESLLEDLRDGAVCFEDDQAHATGTLKRDLKTYRFVHNSEHEEVVVLKAGTRVSVRCEIYWTGMDSELTFAVVDENGDEEEFVVRMTYALDPS